MTTNRRIRTFVTTATVVLVAAAVVGSGAVPAEMAAAPKQHHPAGVGGVKLGKRYIQLRRPGLVGVIRRGCELGGPSARSAPAEGPAQGLRRLHADRAAPGRRHRLRGGARTRGVGVGRSSRQSGRPSPRPRSTRHGAGSSDLARAGAQERRRQLQFAWTSARSGSSDRRPAHRVLRVGPSAGSQVGRPHHRGELAVQAGERRPVSSSAVTSSPSGPSRSKVWQASATNATS